MMHINNMKKTLFVIHELSYSGAPHCMLEMCKIARELGYDVTTWSTKDGPLRSKFNASGFAVRIVPYNEIHSPEIVSLIKSFDLAVCNTFGTDAFALACCKYIPTVWYIHEAAIPHFTKNNMRRLDWLENSKDLACVSEYAAEIIRTYTKHDVAVVRNCTEDVADDYLKTTPGSTEKVRFIQLGYIQEIKGYDVLLEAFRQLPTEYRARAELFFAGRNIPQTSDYGERIIREAEETDHVTYLGELTATDALKKLAEMDVVVVASRSESCSMVALEGAMLSKPLIVTEDVGAKYMVHSDNGIVVKTGDADSLKDAIMKMIDQKDRLKEMGERSRAYYEEMANMDTYRKELGELFKRCEKKNSFSFTLERMRNRVMTSDIVYGLHLCKKKGIGYVINCAQRRLHSN